MNRIEIIGHIGNDAEVKDLGNNQVISFNVAVTEKWKDKQSGEVKSKTDWFQCAKWGNNTSLAQYLKKGTQVYVSGKAEAKSYNGNDGQLKQVLALNVNEIKLLGSVPQQGQQQQNNNYQQPQNNQQFNQQQQNFNQGHQQGNTFPPASIYMEEDHDDLPF